MKSVVFAALLSVFATAPALVGRASADAGGAPSEAAPPDAAPGDTTPLITVDPASIGTNPFIPEDANIGDCVSSVPRPECGSQAQGGWRQYLTMLVLVLGTAFIGWRIARGVRSRDRAMSPPTDP